MADSSLLKGLSSTAKNLPGWSRKNSKVLKIFWIAFLLHGCGQHPVKPQQHEAREKRYEQDSPTLRPRGCMKDVCPELCIPQTHHPACGCLGSHFPRSYAHCSAGKCPLDAEWSSVEDVKQNPEKFLGKKLKFLGYMTAFSESMILWSSPEIYIASEKNEYRSCMSNGTISIYPTFFYQHSMDITGIHTDIDLPTRETMWQQRVEVCGEIMKKSYPTTGQTSIKFELQSVQCLPITPEN
jgi:hypothetical protein